MKRFYSSVSLSENDGQFAVLLDERPIKTPKKRPLLLPTKALAEAIMAEWAVQGDKVDMGSMPLTGFAYAALDTVADNDEQVRSEIRRYGETDLLCYHPEEPDDLCAQIAKAWNPIVDWVKAEQDMSFNITAGVMHIRQSDDTLEKVEAFVAKLTFFELSPFLALTAGLGSIVLTMAVYCQKLTFEQAWALSRIEDIYQMEKWGADAEALSVAQKKHDALVHADRFLSLIFSDR